MREQEAIRRLVKSGPELWAQCSEPDLLARHLSSFGEIRITRLEPESTVAWEGESVSGTVELEASGWGTRVRLTAQHAEIAAEPEVVPEPAVAPEPEAAPEPIATAPEPAPSAPPPAPSEARGLGGLLSRLLGRGRKSPGPVVALEPERKPEPQLQPEPQPELEPEPDPEPAPVMDLLAELEAALNSLGAAHHRPYSR